MKATLPATVSLIQYIHSLKKSGAKRFIAAVHDGLFNLDETLCLAMLKMLCKLVDINLFILRTRDKEKLKDADIVIDVGMEYDPQQWKFDHHQKGGAGSRKPRRGEEKGVPYSAIGLMWKHFGVEFCREVLNKHSAAGFNAKQIEEMAERVDRTLIEGVCALDTGFTSLNNGGLKIPTLPLVMSTFNVTSISHWATGSDADSYQLDTQRSSLDFLLGALIGSVMREADTIANRPRVLQALEKASKSGENRILILDNASQAWRSFVSKNPKILLVVQPQTDGNWGVITTNNTVRESGEDYIFCFPESWRGLKPEELQEVSGVGGITFCHDAGFFVAATSLVDAVQAATEGLRHFDAPPEEVEEASIEAVEESVTA